MKAIPPVAALALFAAIVLPPSFFPAMAAADDVPDLAQRKTGDDWERFLGPHVDGRSRESIRTDWGPEGPKVAWFQEVGEGYSAPSISRGRLFFFDRLQGEARLTAMRSETGEEIWQQTYPTAYEDMYDYSGGPRATPVVDGERVFAFGVEGRLRAHHVVDGRLLWEVDTAKRYGVVQNFFGVASTPVVEDDLLIVHVGGSPPNSPKIHTGEVQGNGTGLVAFDKATGEERWRSTDELAAYSSPVITTIGERRWGFAVTRGGLVGFAPGTGAVDFFFPWRANKLESVNAATPLVVGDMVFITETYGPGSALLRAEPGGYELLRKDPPRGKSMENHWATPIYHEGYVYGSSGRNTGNAELRAVELKTGKVAWSQKGLARSTMILVDGNLLVLTEYGHLLLVEATPERYHVLAEHDFGTGADNVKALGDAAAKTSAEAGPTDRPTLKFPSWNAPVLAHGYVYLRGKDQLICLDLAP